MEKRIRQKLELQQTHAQQMHFKNLRRKAEADEEDEFRKQVLFLLDYRSPPPASKIKRN
jgi:hypothetical protein